MTKEVLVGEGSVLDLLILGKGVSLSVVLCSKN